MPIFLSDKKCTACEGGMPPLALPEIKEFEKQLKIPWRLHDGRKISREFKFANFRSAMVFVNQVAEIAESEGHHPDLHIFYNKVNIELWTHAIGGLSENDFIMAAKIELLAANNS